MALEPNAELLGRVPIFQGLEPYQLATIVKHSREVCFSAGDAIIEAGQKGRTSYLVLSGFVVPASRYEPLFAAETLGYGTFLGELAMLVETTFTVTILARWTVHTLAIQRGTLYALMEHDPSIAYHFEGKLRSRLMRLANDMRSADHQLAILEGSIDRSMGMAG
jgi:CRP-like cAMP-binding protein